MPRRGYRIQPGVSTPGIVILRRGALKGRKIERRNNRDLACSDPISLTKILVHIILSDKSLQFREIGHIVTRLGAIRLDLAHVIFRPFSTSNPGAPAVFPEGATE
jgi:hypothetical protein